MKKFIFVNSFLFILLFGAIISCQETENIDIIEQPDRLFRPLLLQPNIDGNEVEFSWIPIKNATYVLEVTRDSLAFQKDLKTIEISKSNSYKITDLWSNTLYSARIKAISLDPNIKDSEFQEVTFITGIENIFYEIPSTDITKNSIVVHWNKEKGVSHIELFDGKSSIAKYTLLPEEKTSGAKRIDNLLSNYTYTLKIYFDEMLRGTTTVSTF